MKLRFLVLLIWGFAVEAQGQALLQNLNISAAIDFVAPISLDESEDNKLNVRSAEFMFFGPIDHLFDGVINFAGHIHDGAFEFELHEGYIGSSKLIPQSRFRAGKFLLNVGRLNHFHQHDWPFVSAPKVHREFLNPGNTPLQAEGAADTGLEYTWLLPTAHFIDLTLGVTNGYCFGHCDDAGQKPPHPVVYLHPTTFFSSGSQGGVLLGATMLKREDSTHTKTDLYGLDITYKAREGKLLRWLIQSEVFLQTQATPGAARSEKAGLYVYPQYGLSERLSFGMRLDGFSHLNLKFESNGEKRNDLDYAVVPTITYKPSEFSTLRLAYSHEVDTTQGTGDKLDRQVQLQFTYLLGAHPAHDF